MRRGEGMVSNHLVDGMYVIGMYATKRDYLVTIIWRAKPQIFGYSGKEWELFEPNIKLFRSQCRCFALVCWYQCGGASSSSSQLSFKSRSKLVCVLLLLQSAAINHPENSSNNL